MFKELTNLLPPSRQLEIVREYHFRLGVVALSVLTVLIISAGVLLIPTYVFLKNSVSTKTNHLTVVAKALTSSDKTSFSTRLVTLSREADAIVALSNISSPSATIRKIITVSRPGISISNFSYIPLGNKKTRTFILSGTASTRNALRNYQLALQKTDTVISAELPISVFAKDADIPFTINITLTP
jgi:hypothetical protein